MYRSSSKSVNGRIFKGDLAEQDGNDDTVDGLGS